jgi:hypothetical protein
MASASRRWEISGLISRPESRVAVYGFSRSILETKFSPASMQCSFSTSDRFWAQSGRSHANSLSLIRL